MKAGAAQRELNAILNAIEVGVYGLDSAGRPRFITNLWAFLPIIKKMLAVG